jgi:hypothetical protein
MNICLAIESSVVEVDADGLTRAMQAHGHRVQRGPDTAIPSTATARRYVLVDGRHELVVVASVDADGPPLAVHLRPVGAPFAMCREHGLICRPTTGWDSHARAAIEEGPDYLRFLKLLDEFTLVHLGSARFLADHQWAAAVRTREEAFGGLVFSPRTSLLLELDERRFAAVVRALADGRPDALADQLVDPGLRELAGGLARIGAIVPARATS